MARVVQIEVTVDPSKGMSHCRTIMVQGTASHVGKSLVTAALCRWLARQGYRVSPFKAQNMSLNAAVTACGGEIGRSTAFQAAACGVEAEVAMNPVLLKPMGGGRCAVIVKGRHLRVAEGHGTADEARVSLEMAAECLDDLRGRFDVVVLEGMGSPAEINLRGRDAANMRVAELADAPVVLVGDIERGGVFASLAGTLELLEPEERARVRGFLINKYHGDPVVLAPGIEELERRYGVPGLGVLPWLRDLQVEEEDGVALARAAGAPGSFEVLVPRLPGISNFTDLDALAREPGVGVRYISDARDWSAPRLIVLPGSRSVASDLEWLRSQGLASRIIEHARSGGAVVGLCGGYQMLGRRIEDPEGLESRSRCVQGLGLLDTITVLQPEKQVRRVVGRALLGCVAGCEISGYEIHHGRTSHGAGTEPAFEVEGVQDGALSHAGNVWGTYVHGIFDGTAFRRAFLGTLGLHLEDLPEEPAPFDRLADWLEAHVDCGRLVEIIG
jgi:adenosylcobyric acid synthase